MELTFNLTEDRREPLKPQSLKDFELTFGNGSGVNVQSNNWVQGRLQMDNLRQVFVNIQQGKDNEPFDITGYILQFCGRTPFDGKQQSYRVIDNSSVVVDGLHGRFRYTFPAQAFAVAGTYKQAYFRLIRLSDYKCIATLEFDLSVLEDFVFADMVPSDYINPFNDILNQLLDGEKKFKADTQTLYEEAAKRLNDAVTQLTQLGTDVKTTLTTEQAALQQLIEKIKENNLLTQADLDKFSELIDSKLTELNKKITDLANSVEAIRQMGRNNAGLLQYKMVSVTGKGSMGKLALTDNEANHLNAIGAEACIVDMVNITSATDYNPQTSDLSYLQQTIDLLTKHNVPVKMLKPHLGVNWSDGFSRSQYQPDDIPTFFENWKKILLAYAKIADQNKIPILCIGCEQFQQSNDSNVGFWKELTSALRAVYPNLLLTYAFANAEFSDPNHLALCECLDIIGLNVYPTYVYTEDDNNVTLQDTMQSIAYSPAGKQYYKIVDDISSRFHKNILLTEVGVMPLKGGLAKALVDGFDKHTDINDPAYDYSISALVMETIFNTLAKDKNVIGFSWWHLDQPFQFFNLQAATDSLSPAEQVFQKYVKGGIV